MPPEPSKSPAMDELIAILDLEQLEHNLYRGNSPQVGWQRVFGGQVIAQALVAAQRTVANERFVHSLHGYFMLPGDPKRPIIYEVDRIRDGGSFTTRRVVAIQHGAAIFSLSASFQVEENGFDHQIDMPDVPPPESLPDEQAMIEKYLDKAPESVRRYWQRDKPMELRPVSIDAFMSRRHAEPRRQIWVRTTGPVPDDRLTENALLAYMSDMTLLDTALHVHGRSIFDRDIQVASLDHAMWFHRRCNPREWMLYDQDCPATMGGRGLTRGSLFARDGTLVASMAQEGLMRKRSAG